MFGRYLARAQMKRPAERLTLLVRADSQAAATHRIQSITGSSTVLSGVSVLQADLGEPNLGLSAKDYASLAKSVTAILHAAAPTRFDLPLAEARASIVKTTECLARFGSSARHLEQFGYVSTAYAAGRHTGLIAEAALPNVGFVNSYDQAKYEAESFMRSQTATIPLTIYRPSLIVSPNSNKYHAAVMLLKLAQANLLPVLPGQPGDLVDILTADEASAAINSLFNNHFVAGETYHVASGLLAPQIQDVLSLVQSAQAVHFTGYDPSAYRHALSKAVAKAPKLRAVYHQIDCVAAYLLYPKQFSTSQTEAALGYRLGQQDATAALEQALALA